jgi:hypothetical protein
VTDSSSGPGEDHQSIAEIIADVTRRLVREFAGTRSPDVIEAVVTAEAARHSGARITSYVPVLVERRARARLRVTGSGSTVS